MKLFAVHIGMICTYITTAQDQKVMGEHPGNTPQAELSAIVVAVDHEAETVNLQVFLDGFGMLYIKGVKEGKEEGQFSFPEIEWEEDTSFTMDDFDVRITEKIKELLKSEQANLVLTKEGQLLPMSEARLDFEEFRSGDIIPFPRNETPADNEPLGTVGEILLAAMEKTTPPTEPTPPIAPLPEPVIATTTPPAQNKKVAAKKEVKK